MTRTTSIALVGGQETHLNLAMTFGEEWTFEVEGHDTSDLRLAIGPTKNGDPVIERHGTGSVVVTVGAVPVEYEGVTLIYNLWQELGGRIAPEVVLRVI